MKSVKKKKMEIEIKREFSAMRPSSGYGRKNITRLTLFFFVCSPKKVSKPQCRFSSQYLFLAEKTEVWGWRRERFKHFFHFPLLSEQHYMYLTLSIILSILCENLYIFVNKKRDTDLKNIHISERLRYLLNSERVFPVTNTKYE